MAALTAKEIAEIERLCEAIERLDPSRCFGDAASRGSVDDPVMTEPSLTLSTLNLGNTITFDDERRRAGVGAPSGAVASVTIEGGERSWGEFMNRADLLAVRSWIDRVLEPTA